MSEGNKKTVFIVNPSAGRGKCERKWKELQDNINGKYPFEVIYTKQRGEAESVASEVKDYGVDRVFVVGGDGTINEVINGLQDSNIELGIVPFGTGNDLAKTIGIKKDITQIKRMLADPDLLVIKEINVALINERRFIVASGVGFDGAVAKKANDSRVMKALGSLGYFISAISILRSFSPIKMDINIDGNNIHIENGWLLAIGNGPYYGGGMKICPYAAVDDDLLDICIVSNLSKTKILRFMPKVYSGSHAALHNYVTFFKGKHISVHCHNDVVSHADGELISSSLLEIKICPKRLKVLLMS